MKAAKLKQLAADKRLGCSVRQDRTTLFPHLYSLIYYFNCLYCAVKGFAKLSSAVGTLNQKASYLQLQKLE